MNLNASALIKPFKSFAIALAMVSNLATLAQPATSSLVMDRQAIRSLAGCYVVKFNFAETFSPDTAYKIHHPHTSEGLEWVTIIEDSDEKISLQHLLIIPGNAIIKHWREDWTYQNTTLWTYANTRLWTKTMVAKADVQGQWTQEVYQVDDGLRYAGRGTWNHNDGKHVWESICDAPLPRREFTTRSDYNILRRRNRVELSATGIMFEQDNQKLIRGTDGALDKLVVWEKGFEEFTPASADQCQPAMKWWTLNQDFWAVVREVWTETYEANTSIQMHGLIDNKALWEEVFRLGKDAQDAKSKKSKTTLKKEIQQVINRFIASSSAMK